MSKILFSQEAITMLKQNEVVTHTSEKSIGSAPEFRVKIATCKTKCDAAELFESVYIASIFGVTSDIKLMII